MPTFYCEYTILKNQQTRDACMTFFAGMTEADDQRELGKVNLLGRWSTIGEGRGFCIAEAPDAAAMSAWLSNWVPMADIYTVPVLTDNEHRAMILGKEPSYKVSYDMVSAAPKAGESLYFIKYKFHCGKRSEGFKAFASMTEEQDEADGGDCTSYGRWHVPSEGCGYAIASAPSAAAIYKWAYNWEPLCDCEIQGVTGDATTRAILRKAPGFAAKHAALMEQLGIETGPHHVTATFTMSSADKRAAFENILKSPTGLAKTRAAPGCHGVDVLQDPENPLVVVFQQKWARKSDWQTLFDERKASGMLDKVQEFGTLEIQHRTATKY
tara:strand:- start:15 stop:989 length:975 start_codon:yes stop_codon:yes gene_type:complete